MMQRCAQLAYHKIHCSSAPKSFHQGFRLFSSIHKNPPKDINWEAQIPHPEWMNSKSGIFTGPLPHPDIHHMHYAEIDEEEDYSLKPQSKTPDPKEDVWKRMAEYENPSINPHEIQNEAIWSSKNQNEVQNASTYLGKTFERKFHTSILSTEITNTPNSSKPFQIPYPAQQKLIHVDEAKNRVPSEHHKYFADPLAETMKQSNAIRKHFASAKDEEFRMPSPDYAADPVPPYSSPYEEEEKRVLFANLEANPKGTILNDNILPLAYELALNSEIKFSFSKLQ